MSSEPLRHSVTAIVVAHDGSRWLPEVLEALRSQTRQPDYVVAVDNDSRDRSSSLLADELGAQRVATMPRDTGFGEAVARALQHPAAGTPTSMLEMAGSGGSQWIWLLHDDCAPQPETLERLLAAADENRHAAVLGPKLRDWLDRRVLLEAGVTIDGAGRRETGLEPREFDQGQHDEVYEVLAVSTASMLVRRDIWDTLGGLSPELPLFRDDVDFGWRVNASGQRVLVVTDAVACHAEATSQRRRRLSLTSEHPRRLDRRSALFVLFANLPGRLAAWALFRNFFGGLVRAAVFLLAKQPGNAWDEARAYGSVIGSPLELHRIRRQRRRGPRRSYRTLRKLMPPWWHGLRRLADMVASFFVSSGPVEGGRHHAVAESMLEEEGPPEPDGSAVRQLFRKPAFLLFLGLTAVTLAAERALLTGGRLGGGALLPLAGGAGDLWGQYLSSWHAIGLGSGAPAPPYTAVVALLGTLLLGNTDIAVTVLLLGSVPLAGLSAYAASQVVVPDARIRAWAAASYALLPVASGAIAAGRLGTAVVFVLLPLIGMLAAGVVLGGHREAMRAAWGAAGLLAVATSFVPLAWVLAAVLAALAYRKWGRTNRRLAIRLGIALAIPLALLLPWTFRLFRHPGLLLREAGLPAAAFNDAPGPLSVLLLQPGGVGTPPGWVAVGLVAAGLAALAVRARRAATTAGWTLGVLGMGGGVVASRLTVAPPGEPAGAPGWPGVCMALAGAGVIVAAAAGIEGLLAPAAGDAPDVPHDANQGDGDGATGDTPGGDRGGDEGGVDPAVPAHMASLVNLASPSGSSGSSDSPGASVPAGGWGRSRRRLRGGPRMPRALPRMPRALPRMPRALPRMPRALPRIPSGPSIARVPGIYRLHGSRWRPFGAAVLAVLACSAPVASAGFWVYTGVTGPLDRSNPPVLPAFVEAKSVTDAQPRTLLLRAPAEGRVSYTVLRDEERLLGSSEMPTPPGITDHVASIVAGLAAGRRTGEVSQLARYGIQYVVMPGPLDTRLLQTLDANPRLSRISQQPSLAVWELDAAASRLRLLPGGEGSGSPGKPIPSGRVSASATIPPGPPGRTLMLAASAHPGWRATVNGTELARKEVDGWAQGFQVPAAGGRLVLEHTSWRWLWLTMQALLAFVVLVLALPGGGQQPETETAPAPRSERRKGRRPPRRARGHRASRSHSEPHQ